MRTLFMIVAIVSIICFSASVGYNAEYWAKTFQLFEFNTGDSILQTTDGGYIVAGTIHYLGPVDCWILKLNRSGAVEWQKTYKECSASSIQYSSDGGYIISGSTESNEALVFKIDNRGNILWQKSFSSYTSANIIQQTTDGEYILAGDYLIHIYLLKLNESGNVTWQKIYDGGGDKASVTSIQQTTDGGYIIGAWISPYMPHEADAWILKLDADGNIIWKKAYSTSSWNGSYPSILQNMDGEYMATCSTSGGSAVLKLNSTGNILWQKSYAGWQFYSMQQTINGDYVLAGSNSDGIGVLWLNQNGNVTWQKTYFLGNESDFATTILQNSDGGYLVGGYTYINGVDHFLLNLNDNGEIPDCDNMLPFDTVVSEINFEVYTTNVTTWQISTTVNEISMTSQDTSTEVTTYCCYDSEDLFPQPNGNGIGDACDCEGNFDCDEDCDGSDAAIFKVDFGRSQFQRPCNVGDPCNGDFDCDNDCDGTDAATFKTDFGRSGFSNPCPVCEMGEWCSY